MRQKPNFQNMGSEELMRQKRKSSSRLTKTGRKMGNGAPKTDCKETQRARVMKKEKGSGRLDGNPIERRSLRRRSALLKLQKNRGKVGKRRTELTQSINQSIKQCAAAGLLLTLLVLGLLPGRRVLLVREASSWCSWCVLLLNDEVSAEPPPSTPHTTAKLLPPLLWSCTITPSEVLDCLIF